MHYRWKRNTVFFLAAQAISIFGSSLVQYAITWHITLTTQSGVFAMLSIVCGFLPTFFLAPFAGVWADRYNRKLLIILADGGIALATLALAILFQAGQGSIWLLLGAMAVRALGGAIQQPCINAMLPDMVPTEHLTRVNGINGSLNSLITLLSPMVSGALMGFAPLQYIFMIDVLTAILGIGVMLFGLQLPKRAEKPKPEAGSYLAEMKAGIGYVFKHRYLRNFFGFCIVLWVMSGPVAFLTPLQIARNYGDDVWRLTVMEVIFSVGMLAGGILISAWGGFKNRIHTICAAGLVMAVGMLALGFAMPFWPYIVVMGVIGLVMPSFNTPAIVLLQERVDADYVGRVFGIMTMLSSSLMPMGMLVFGPLADLIPIEYLLWGTGLVMLGGILLMLRNKPLLAAGRVPAPAQPPEAA